MSVLPKHFRLSGEVYEFGSPDHLTLRDLLMVEAETADLPKVITMGEINRLSDLFQTLTPDEAKIHPDGGWMFAITIWLAMVKKTRDGGDYTTKVTFAAAIDANLAEFEMIEPPTGPQDHLPGKQAGAKKRPKGSGQAAKPRPASQTA